MRRLLAILALWLITSPAYAFSPAIQAVVSGDGAAPHGTESIGQTSVGGTGGEPFTINYNWCTKLGGTPTYSGTVTSIVATLYGDVTNPIPVKAALYTHDSANDLPDALVTNSVTDEVSVNTAAYADRTFTYSGTQPTVTAGAQYWICFARGTSTAALYHKYDATGKRAAKAMSYGTWSAFGGSAETATKLIGKAYLVNSY